MRDAEVIIHNATFDLGFLDAELERVGRAPFSSHCGPITDTLVLARTQFPGKFNSLDALCKRFGVDNTRRTLHGALLDAELLAEVYIWLTRGQDSLVIELDSSAQGAAAAPADLSGLALMRAAASADELAEHERILQDLEKSSSGKAVWPPSSKTVA